jgi:hypothetical protein
MQTVTGIFETHAQATAAVRALTDAGILGDSISLVSSDGAGEGASDSMAATAPGDFMVMVRAGDSQAALATSILHQSGSRSLDSPIAGDEGARPSTEPMKPEDYRREDNPANDTLPPPLPQ